MAKIKTPIKAATRERLEKVVMASGLRGYMFAEEIGVSQQLISKLLNGKAPMTISTAEKIHEMFPGYSVPWLLGYDDAPNDSGRSDAIVFCKDCVHCTKHIYPEVVEYSCQAGFSFEDDETVRPYDFCSLAQERGTKEIETVVWVCKDGDYYTLDEVPKEERN